MKSYLVIQLARFGDLIQTARLIDSLIREGEVHLCVDRTLIDIANIIYPQCIVHGIVAHQGNSDEVVSCNYRVFEKFIQCNFYQVFNLNYSGLNIAISSLFPSDIVKGYKIENGQVFRDPWIRMAFTWTKQRTFSPLNLMDFWGLLAPKPIPPSEVNPPATSKGKGLGIVLAGRQARRSLPPDVLAPIISILFETIKGKDIYLLGSKTERSIGRQLMACLPRQILSCISNLAGKTNWYELAETLDGLDLLITPDTGTMHLAARLGVPICGMFLSSAWVWETGPYGKGHHVWQATTDCAPCLESKPCTFDVRCLDAYKSPEFYKCLSGKSEQLPTDLTCFISSFDSLGLTWKSTDENAYIASIRRAKRALLEEYQGITFAHHTTFPELNDGTLAMELFNEIDWILPNRV